MPATTPDSGGSTAATYQHFLLTRMNTSTPFGTPGACVDPDWLRHRFSLFETYTLPSVRAQQGAAHFEWLLFSHEETPVEFRERLDSYERSFPAIRIVRCTGFDEDVARLEVLRHCSSDVTHIITSRVDNDDALGTTYMATVQREFRAQQGEFINCRLGFQLHRGRVYRAEHPANPFCSAIESKATFRGVFCVAHVDIANTYPVKQLDDRRRWLMVIHDRNALNRVQGVRCRSDELKLEFGFLAGMPFADGAVAIGAEQLTQRLAMAGKATRVKLRTLLRGSSRGA